MFHFGHLTLISLLIKPSHFYKCLQVKVSYLLDIYRSINGDWELQTLKAQFPTLILILFWDLQSLNQFLGILCSWLKGVTYGLSSKKLLESTFSSDLSFSPLQSLLPFDPSRLFGWQSANTLAIGGKSLWVLLALEAFQQYWSIGEVDICKSQSSLFFFKLLSTLKIKVYPSELETYCIRSLVLYLLGNIICIYLLTFIIFQKSLC